MWDGKDRRGGEPPTGLGQKIRDLRMKRGMLGRDLARAIEEDPSTISRWESGRVTPNARSLAAIALALGTTVEGLMDGSMPPREAEMEARLPAVDPGAFSLLQRVVENQVFEVSQARKELLDMRGRLEKLEQRAGARFRRTS